ncbi:MAG: hypothetical protein EPN43_08485 [Jatrophihabitans sp.]|nr:MAG: hypothetical protein EPN43_08485 [Jatrophihabitans sp.]
MSALAIADAAGAAPVRGRRRSGRALTPVVVLALTGALLAVRRAQAPFADGDILWGTRSGSDILAGHGLPHADSYSWTAHGVPWVPNSWGWNVLLALAYRLAGFVGIALLGIALLAATGALLGVAVRRAGAATAWGALTMQIGLGLLALFLYPRAQLADYAAVVAVPLLVSDALGSSRSAARRAAIGLVAVQVVWMNLHTTAVIGPVIVLAVGAGTFASDRSRATALRTLGLAALTAGACLATPYGTAPIAHLAEVRAASVGLISEWRPAGFGSPEQILAVIALAFGAVAALSCVRRRSFDTVALLAVFAVMTATALRFAPLLMLVAIPPLARAAGRIRARPQFVDRICVLALAILTVVCAAGAAGFAHPGAQNTSPRLVDALPHGCRLVNDMGVGGAVILSRPDVLVSIDSRNDMYGRAAELTALRVLGDAAYGDRYVTEHRVTCVLAPTGAPLVTALSHAAQWRVAATDADRTLLLPRGVR